MTAVFALVALLPGSLLTPGQARAESGAAVPSRLYVPWTWQATVAQSPPGAASVLISGAGGLRGNDLIDHEGKVAVVGRDGSYRMLLYGGAETVAGEQVQLSPDGRYVAQPGWGDGAAVEVVDLETGKVRTYRGGLSGETWGEPVAWSPDGRRLVALHTTSDPVHVGDDGEERKPGVVVLIDLRSGKATTLAEVSNVFQVRTASLAAFSPDSRRVALNLDGQLRLLDTEGDAIWSVEVGPRQHLAGIGAFTPDGGRITVVTLDGCVARCDSTQLATRRWSFGYRDAATGEETDGPRLAPVRAMAVRALGWREGRDVVAVTYRPADRPDKTLGTWMDTDYWQTDGVSLVALGSGEPKVLVELPDEVLAVDVARDLVEEGKFGGPSPRPAAWPARPDIVAILAVPVLLVVVPLGLVAFWLVRRWRRRVHAANSAANSQV